MKKDRQKMSLNFLASNTSVKKGYSPEGAIWKKSSAPKSGLQNGQDIFTNVNAGTGVDDNSKFSLDPSGNIQ